MHNSVKWATGSATLRTESVGPRHDPYTRTIVELTVKNNIRYRLTSCALAGSRLEFVDASCIPDIVCYDEFDTAAKDFFAETIERATGYPFEFWVHDLWERVDAARYRRDPKGYEMQQAYEAMARGCI